MYKIAISDICTAFKAVTVGSKVTNSHGFTEVLREAIEAHDFSKDRIPGQGFLQIPDAVPYVSSGVGKASTDPKDYVLREHRSNVSMFLRREHSAPVTGCAAVVYTMEAYAKDPDVTYDELRLMGSDTTHILVAVLAFAGPQSPLSPHRFTANLAGGNREAQMWTADEIRAKAREIIEYHDQWSMVAD